MDNIHSLPESMRLVVQFVAVSLNYMALQLAISLGFVYLCPVTVLAHWTYQVCAAAVLTGAYVVFMRRYYHLYEEYLARLKN